MEPFKMFNKKSLTCLLALSTMAFSPLCADHASSGRILYLAQSGNLSDAIKIYQEQAKAAGQHDFELLQQLGFQILSQGYKTKDPEIQLLTLFGAGISANEKALPILEAGLDSENPQLQMVALNFISRYSNDEADEAINRLMKSNFLLVRLEAAYHLAQKKFSTASGQTEALMQKVDKQLWPIFPQLFGLIGDKEALIILRKLMNDPSEAVRIESIITAAKCGRDDLLPSIRRLATQHHTGQQEACCYALGKLKDDSSIDKLQQLANSSSPHVSLAAQNALYQLGKKEMKEVIEQAAKKLNPFAITLLADIENSDDTLISLLDVPDGIVRLNAAMTLLEKQNPKCVPILMEAIIRDNRDLAFAQVTTQGKAFTAWKIIPSAMQNLESQPYIYELSMAMREHLLAKMADLPEPAFLALAQTIFDKQQGDLIPTLVRTLENIRSPQAIELLKTNQQKIGAPLIRNYCNLALYRMGQEGPYADNLKQWVSQQQHVSIIQFRTFVPWEMRPSEPDSSNYQLTAQETSQLLIESVEALAKSQDNASVDALLNAILNGNEKNKFALAGLLLRTIQ